MRLRLLAFLPFAGLATGLLLFSAASLVSALERSFYPEPAGSNPPIRIGRFESECERLDRELASLRESVLSRYELQGAMVRSPLLWSVAHDGQIGLDYDRIRTLLNERCGRSMGRDESLFRIEAIGVGSVLDPDIDPDIGADGPRSKIAVEGPPSFLF